MKAPSLHFSKTPPVVRFALMITLLLMVAGPSQLQAQDAEQPELNRSLEIESRQNDEQEILAAADTGFWFLTTENSPQSFGHGCPRFCPAVSRYDECAGFRPGNYQELLASLEPGLPVCIMIHGSFVDTSSACCESKYVWNWLRSASKGHRMQFVYFSWPSYSRITPLVQIDVNSLGRRAARNGYYLAELVSQLPPECPVCLIGHSHGTRVTSGALQMLSGGAVQGICHPYARVNGRPIRTVFSASAIDHHWLNPGYRYDRVLRSTQCLLNMTNRVDPAMQIYPMRFPLIAKRALGLTGLTPWDRRQLGGWGNKVVDYDVSRVVGRCHLYPHYFRHPSLAMVMHNYVYFPDRNPVITHPQESTAGGTTVRSHSAGKLLTVTK